MPIFNLVPAAYAVPARMQLRSRALPNSGGLYRSQVEARRWMVTILLPATMLHQLFLGELLAAPGLSQMEDMARSTLVIALNFSRIGIGWLCPQQLAPGRA